MDKSSYLGGLYTGEGHFGLMVRRRKSGLIVGPVCALSMADEETMDTASSFLCDLGVAHYRTRRTTRGRVQYVIRVDGYKRVRRLLGDLLPYLTGDKRKSAEIVSEFIESRLGRFSGRRGVAFPYTEHELQLVSDLREHHQRPGLAKNHF